MLAIGHFSFCCQFDKATETDVHKSSKDFICWWSVATPTLIWKLYVNYSRGRKMITSACTSTVGKQFRCPPLSWGGKGLRSKEGTAIISPFNPCPFSWCPTSFSWCVLCGTKVTILTRSLLVPDTTQKIMKEDVLLMGSLIRLLFFSSIPSSHTSACTVALQWITEYFFQPPS